MYGRNLESRRMSLFQEAQSGWWVLDKLVG